MGSLPLLPIMVALRITVRLLWSSRRRSHSHADEHGGSLRLHPPLLSGMGVLIGELFALDALAEECKRENRWHFYFSSQPIMVEGGVASPPNAVAIF